MSRRTVDLPQPEGPSNATNCPGQIVVERPFSAVTPLSKRLSTAISSIAVDMDAQPGSCPYAIALSKVLAAPTPDAAHRRVPRHHPRRLAVRPRREAVPLHIRSQMT